MPFSRYIRECLFGGIFLFVDKSGSMKNVVVNLTTWQMPYAVIQRGFAP